jgi:hypothetical protein
MGHLTQSIGKPGLSISSHRCYTDIVGEQPKCKTYPHIHVDGTRRNRLVEVAMEHMEDDPHTPE